MVNYPTFFLLGIGGFIPAYFQFQRKSVIFLLNYFSYPHDCVGITYLKEPYKKWHGEDPFFLRCMAKNEYHHRNYEEALKYLSRIKIQFQGELNFEEKLLNIQSLIYSKRYSEGEKELLLWENSEPKLHVFIPLLLFKIFVLTENLTRAKSILSTIPDYPDTELYHPFIKKSLEKIEIAENNPQKKGDILKDLLNIP